MTFILTICMDSCIVIVLDAILMQFLHYLTINVLARLEDCDRTNVS